MSIRDGGHWGPSQKLLTTPSHRRGNEGQSVRHSHGVGSSSGVVDQGSLRGFPNRHHGPPDPIKVMGLGPLGVPAHSLANVGAIGDSLLDLDLEDRMASKTKISTVVMLVTSPALGRAWPSSSQRTEALWKAGCLQMSTLAQKLPCSGSD